MSNQVSETRLPLELILAVLESLLACETWESRAPQLNRVLLLNRTVYEGIVKSAYATVVLNSVNAASLFYDTLKATPRLSDHVENIWVATSQMEPFDSSDYPFKWVEARIENILGETKNMKRVGIPYAYFPRGLPSVTHLTTTSDLFPPVTPFLYDLESLYIHGLPSHHCVNTVLTRFGNVRRVSINVHPTPDEDETVSVICARMVMSFRGRLTNMEELRLIVNPGVSRILKEGMKKTLEDDARIYICGGREEELYYNSWLRYG